MTIDNGRFRKISFKKDKQKEKNPELQKDWEFHRTTKSTQP